MNFWDHHRARFLEKKSKIIACDVIGRTKKIKIICADRVSVRLYCDVKDVPVQESRVGPKISQCALK